MAAIAADIGVRAVEVEAGELRVGAEVLATAALFAGPLVSIPGTANALFVAAEFEEEVYLGDIPLMIGGGAFIINYAVAIEGIPRAFADAILSLSQDPLVLLILINLLFLVMGMFLDTMVLLLPHWLTGVRSILVQPKLMVRVNTMRDSSTEIRATSVSTRSLP